jgi:phospholipid transport system substrate-binding protein
MSRFVLGPYWRATNAAQQQEFRTLFEDYLLHFYGRRLMQYGGQSFRVTGSRTDGAGIVVTSQILRRYGPPIAIDWRLGISDGRYKIDDVAIEGVSMALARRSEFAAVIARDGGQVEGLLALLREQAD